MTSFAPCNERSFDHATAAPTELAYSPDGHWLLSTHEDGSAWGLEIASGRAARLFQSETRGRFPNAAAISADGGEIALAVCGRRPPTIERLAFPGGEALSSIPAKVDDDDDYEAFDFEISAIAYQPASGESALIATGHAGGQIVLWEWTSGDLVQQVSPNANTAREETSVSDVGFSTDGKTLISCGYEHVIRLFDVPGLEPAGTLETPGEGEIDSLDKFSLSRDGQSVATCGTAYLQVWDLASRRSTFLLRGTAKDDNVFWASRCALTPDGNVFAVEEGNGFSFFTHDDHKEAFDFQFNLTGDDFIQEFEFSPDGEQLAAVLKSGTIKIWEIDRTREY